MPLQTPDADCYKGGPPFDKGRTARSRWLLPIEVFGLKTSRHPDKNVLIGSETALILAGKERQTMNHFQRSGLLAGRRLTDPASTMDAAACGRSAEGFRRAAPGDGVFRWAFFEAMAAH